MILTKTIITKNQKQHKKHGHNAQNKPNETKALFKKHFKTW